MSKGMTGGKVIGLLVGCAAAFYVVDRAVEYGRTAIAAGTNTTRSRLQPAVRTRSAWKLRTTRSAVRVIEEPRDVRGSVPRSGPAASAQASGAARSPRSTRPAPR